MRNVAKHFKKIEKKTEKISQINGIDYIYLVNLDERPEKLKRCLGQLGQFGIFPHRFPAIYGWTLSQEVFDDIGMKFMPPMDFRCDKQVFFRMASDQRDPGEPLNQSSYGKVCVHKGTSAGSLGGSLSHLSCIQDGYDSNFDTIWVLEDDFTLSDDPHLLAYYIEKLDEAVGKDGWDVLYTDDDHFFPPVGRKNIFVRPDRPSVDHLYEHRPVGKDFFKIGGRWQLHSVIYRRSGMEKILNYIKKFGLFNTLDVEVNYTPDIRMYNLKCGLIHGRDRTVSDTQMEFFK